MYDTPKQIYRISKAWRVFLFFGVTIIIAGLVYYIAATSMGYTLIEGSTDIFYKVIAGILCFVLPCGLIGFYRWRIEIYEDRLRIVERWRSQTAYFRDIEGIKIMSNRYGKILQIILKESNSQKLNVGLIMENKKQFITWAQDTFGDIELKNYQEQLKSITEDENLGDNKEARMDKLKKAKKWAGLINAFGCIIAAYAFFYPQPYNIIMWTLIIIPFLALSLMVIFSGRIKMDGPKESPYPTIAMAFSIPCVVLAMRAMLDWQIVNYKLFWIPSAIFAGVLYIAVIFVAKDMRENPKYMVLVLLICIAYGYGATTTINGLLDTSVSTVYEADVINKRINDGKYKTMHYLELSPWGEVKEQKEVSVDKSTYDYYGAGDTVKVMEQKGALKIKWFFVK